MTPTDILHHRLLNQQIAETSFTKPQEIVYWLGAMQAQEWAMAKWAIGLRVPGLKDADVENAFNEGQILRTHLLRPTWHFVAPADIRWLLALTAPRVHAGNAFMYRKLELDQALLTRANDALAAALQGGKHLTRPALQAALAKAGVQAEGQRLGYVMMQAELDGIVCSGPRQGKQFTYALLEERVPPAKALNREEALAQLTRRYFTSRGLATLPDFVWWSGLTTKDARAGVATLPPHFVQQEIGGQTYVFAPQELPTLQPSQTTFLMPDYDEYGISYKNRGALFSNIPLVQAGNGTYDHMVVVDGVVAGTWKRVLNGKIIEMKTATFYALSALQQEALADAVKRYDSFTV